MYAAVESTAWAIIYVDGKCFVLNRLGFARFKCFFFFIFIE